MRDANFQSAEPLWTPSGARSYENDSSAPSQLQSTFPLYRGSSLRTGYSRMDASILTPNSNDANSRTFSDGRERSSRAGGAHGRHVRPIGGRSSDGSPRFDQPVSSGGYLWWYIDALSDDGQHGLSLIAFVGSVFSPYYAKAYQHQFNPMPEDHCALNVALYTPAGNLWAMTERPKESVHRSSHEFVIGPSKLQWDGQALHIDIDEWSVPFLKRIRGRVSVYPEQLFDFSTALDSKHQHHWGPIAPSARVKVDLDAPKNAWRGHAYIDSNEGSEPIAKGFKEWDWSRTAMKDGSTCVLYDCQFNQGEDRLLALKFLPNGQVESFDAPPRCDLPKTFWGMKRRLRSEKTTELVQQLEDTPFYQRALIQHQLQGEECVSFHETLNANRFDSRWVQMLLPWRMPRKAHRFVSA